jgi:hypothetical protein
MRIIDKMFRRQPELSDDSQKGLFLYNLDWMLYHDFINIEQYNALLNKGIAHFNEEDVIYDPSRTGSRISHTNDHHANRI